MRDSYTGPLGKTRPKAEGTGLLLLVADRPASSLSLHRPSPLGIPTWHGVYPKQPLKNVTKENKRKQNKMIAAVTATQMDDNDNLAQKKDVRDEELRADVEHGTANVEIAPDSDSDPDHDPDIELELESKLELESGSDPEMKS